MQSSALAIRQPPGKIPGRARARGSCRALRLNARPTHRVRIASLANCLIPPLTWLARFRCCAVCKWLAGRATIIATLFPPVWRTSRFPARKCAPTATWKPPLAAGVALALEKSCWVKMLVKRRLAGGCGRIARVSGRRCLLKMKMPRTDGTSC